MPLKAAPDASSAGPAIIWRTLAAAFLLCPAACSRTSDDVPPRVDDKIVLKPQPSILAVPIEADLSQLGASLEQHVPHDLWSIDKPDQTCIPSDKVKVLFLKLKTPTIKCRIVGRVTRGPLSLSGSGRTLQVVFPVHAMVQARDIAGILKQETATADARVHAKLELDLASDWTPRARIDLAYRWTDPPSIEFLGQRIDLTRQADDKLRGVLKDLERSLPDELSKLQVRQRVQQAWNAAFTTIQLNSSNPPVWLRLSPRELQYGGYDISGNRLTLRLGLRALTETFVGERPAYPPQRPLPPLKPLRQDAGKLAFFIPVIADYRELEPVLVDALRKRQRRAFEVPGVGPVWADFNKATIYGTTGGRIAVGLNFTARAEANTIGEARATVWLTGRPMNQPNSRKVAFTQFAVSGTTDRVGGDLVIKLANAPGLSGTIAAALIQNFESDYEELMVKINRAIEERREGGFIIRANVEKIQTGSLQASGQGLHLPVRGMGEASIVLAPE